MSGGPLVIVGDALLDRDVTGQVSRLCPDAPAPVVEDPVARARPGGAALAATLAAMGDEVVLVAPFGTDPASEETLRMLPGAVTVVRLPLDGPLQAKTRVLAGSRTLLRVDSPAGAPGPAGPRAVAAIKAAGAILVSDYGRGATSDPEIRQALAGQAARVPVVWDPHPKGAPPTGGTLVATPSEAEAHAAAGILSGDGGLRSAAAAAERLLSKWTVDALVVTLGARGALLTRRGTAPLALPAQAVAAPDPCGAGDRFAVAVAAALRDGALLSEAVTWAVTAAGQYLAEGGVATVAAITGADAWAARPGAAARPGGRPPVLVATGGCFDLLHAGHVAMLRAARALGDSLVVCLNSDASVRRLKGPGRPLNTAADRAAVLRALDCVDDVVTFNEDTPERVLADLRPAIWVKGGDYDGRDLPEAATLRQWGGLVVTVPYLDGRSTTRIASAAAQSARAAQLKRS